MAVDDWLDDYQMQMESAGYADDADLVRFLTMHLEGRAGMWFRQYWKQQPIGTVMTWKQVAADMCAQYHADDRSLLLARFQAMKPDPNGSLTDYANDLEAALRKAMPRAEQEYVSQMLTETFIRNIDDELAAKLKDRFLMGRELSNFKDIKFYAAKWELTEKKLAKPEKEDVCKKKDQTRTGQPPVAQAVVASVDNPVGKHAESFGWDGMNPLQFPPARPQSQQQLAEKSHYQNSNYQNSNYQNSNY